MFKLVVTLFFVWVCLTVASYFIAVLIVNPSDSQRYVDNGVQLYAKVTAKDPDNHQLVTYSYIVNGVRYEGHGQGRAGNPSFDQINIGQQVIVFYDKNSPENSVMGFPQSDLETNQSLVWAVTFALPIFPMIVISLIFVLHYLSKK